MKKQSLCMLSPTSDVKIKCFYGEPHQAEWEDAEPAPV